MNKEFLFNNLNIKGVMISHGNLLSSLKALISRVQVGYKMSEKDLYIAYLPLAHVLELCCEIGFITNGVRIGYSSPNTLTDQSSAIKSGELGDLRTLRPTIMAAVPAVLGKFY
jgi:long-chain acyl-CoA synthetase